MAERIESLKAGIIGALCLIIAFFMTTLVNNLVLATNFEQLASLATDSLSLRSLVSVGIVCFCGLLFGVTYRYIIRADKNPQLKAGGVLAFGLVRGLTQVEVGLSDSKSVLPYVVLGVESILWFGLAAFFLDTAMQLGWIKPFQSK
ncbi:hypothetical protein SAMD00079811_27760 [Scytonema sp. HK-05]|nr:hypothetical protein NIES2130_01920 [Scytonema sp. HK-05]BAY45174.1 hypothetical protein SAMD00079811_27760 [Scytonema sp. HK-05]